MYCINFFQISSQCACVEPNWIRYNQCGTDSNLRFGHIPKIPRKCCDRAGQWLNLLHWFTRAEITTILLGWRKNKVNISKVKSKVLSEIQTIFCSHFGRNYDFMNFLTFRRLCGFDPVTLTFRENSNCGRKLYSKIQGSNPCSGWLNLFCPFSFHFQGQKNWASGAGIWTPNSWV